MLKGLLPVGFGMAPNWREFLISPSRLTLYYPNGPCKKTHPINAISFVSMQGMPFDPLEELNYIYST